LLPLQSKILSYIHIYIKMNYSIDKIAELFTLHSELKTLDFISFMKRISEYITPIQSRWANSSTNSLVETKSTSGSISDDEELVVVPAKFDRQLSFLFTNIPVVKQTTLWVMLRNQYITNPSSFRLIGEGHISNDETDPHITIRVETPILERKTAETIKPWITNLHIYYTLLDDGIKRRFTHILMKYDNQKQFIAAYAV